MSFKVEYRWSVCEGYSKKVHSKPFIKIIGILLLIVRFVKCSDQTIIQIISKNKSVLMFLANPGDCFTGTYLKASQHHRKTYGTL